MSILSGDQMKRLRAEIVRHYTGESQDMRFQQFVKSELDLDIYDYTPKNVIFQTKVWDLLRSLDSPNVNMLLAALKREAPNNDRLQSVLNSITVEIQSAPVPFDNAKPSSLIAVVVNGNPIEKRYAGRLAELFKEVMNTFDFKHFWEDPSSLAEIDRAALVIVVISRIGRESDPPLAILKEAVKHLQPPKMFLIVALDQDTFGWSCEHIRNNDYKELIRREKFSDSRGNLLSLTDDDVTNVWRVQQLGVALQDAITASSLTKPTQTSSASAPIILLGEARGNTPASVAEALSKLKFELKQRGLEFVHWQDGWLTEKPPSASILTRDPIFIRTVEDFETDTQLVASKLDSDLNVLFRTTIGITELLPDCRRVLWRPDSPLVWDLLRIGSASGFDIEDIDNLETRSDSVVNFSSWLKRFVNPAALILHEAMNDQRPPELIRLLRTEIIEFLSIESDGVPFVRVKTFSRLLSFGREKLTVVAIDDLPVTPGPGFRDRALQRFREFRREIDNIVSEKNNGATAPAIFPIALLVQDARFYEDGGRDLGRELNGWTAVRITRAHDGRLEAKQEDLAVLRKQLQSR